MKYVFEYRWLIQGIDWQVEPGKTLKDTYLNVLNREGESGWQVIGISISGEKSFVQYTLLMRAKD